MQVYVFFKVGANYEHKYKQGHILSIVTGLFVLKL